VIHLALNGNKFHFLIVFSEIRALKKDIVNDQNRIPKHVAIIMDGNGRWAKQKGEMRIFGHTSGVDSVREALTAAGEIGVEYLTLYAFSTENWNRPKEEIAALMDLLVQSIYNEVGGEAEYQKLIGWATENLSQAEQDAYNNALEGDIESAKLTLRGIQARAGSTNSSEPQLTQGQATQGRTDVFNSSAEVVQAINDKRYQEDTHYRSQVEQKLARSKVF
jgi:undecaprenyl diphosphate synthase